MNLIGALIAFIVIESMQVLILTVHVYSFIPIPWPSPVPLGLEPERESFFYMVFLSLICVGAFVAFKWIKPKIEETQSQQEFIVFLQIECWWIFWQLFAFFKWLTYRYPFYNVLNYEDGGWVIGFFYGAVVCSILSKVFWPEIRQILSRFMQWHPHLNWLKMIDVGVLIFIFACLGVVRLDDILALNYIWDHMNHLDRWMLNAPFTSYQGIIIFMIVSMTIIFASFYLLLRQWLRSIPLAIFGLVMAIKMGLFHYGCSPTWLIPPSADGFMSLMGFQNWPIYKPLQMRQFFPFFMTFFVPVFFVLSIFLLWFRRVGRMGQEDCIAWTMVVGGLIVYPLVIVSPTTGVYGLVSLPLMGLVCFWIKLFCVSNFSSVQRAIYCILACVGVVMLLTNRLFIIYPHIWQTQDRFVNERKFYQQSFDFTQEVALIQSWTKPNERVAMMSSFEVGILKQANRLPFFTKAPILLSTLPMEKEAGGLRLNTKEEVLNLLKVLDEWMPSIFFMDKRLWLQSEEKYTNTAIGAVMIRMHSHYSPIAESRYLVVLKKKG